MYINDNSISRNKNPLKLRALNFNREIALAVDIPFVGDSK